MGRPFNASGVLNISYQINSLSGHTLLKLGYAMHTQWYVIHTILLHTSGVFRFGMKYTPLYAHYLMALAPPRAPPIYKCVTL